jgi:hypothetical protein
VAKTWIASLAGATAVLTVVGAFLALDKTTLHWYASESTNAASRSQFSVVPEGTFQQPTAAATATLQGVVPETPEPPEEGNQLDVIAQVPAQQATPLPQQVATQVPSNPTATRVPRPTRTPTPTPSPLFQPGEAVALAEQWWDPKEQIASISDCFAVWRWTHWEVPCKYRSFACSGIGCAYRVRLCVYEASRSVAIC